MSFVSDNDIKEIDGLNSEKLNRLHTLELRGNKLESLKGIELPDLKNLFVVSCFIHLTPEDSIYTVSLQSCFRLGTRYL